MIQSVDSYQSRLRANIWKNQTGTSLAGVSKWQVLLPVATLSHVTESRTFGDTPPTTWNPFGASWAHPCFTKFLATVSLRFATSLFLGMTDKGINKCLIWLTPRRDLAIAILAALCNAGDPSGAAICDPERNFWKTGSTVSGNDSAPCPRPAQDRC